MSDNATRSSSRWSLREVQNGNEMKNNLIEELITNLKFLDGLNHQERYLKKWFAEQKESFSPEQVREWTKMLKEKKTSIQESRSKIDELFEKFKGTPI